MAKFVTIWVGLQSKPGSALRGSRLSEVIPRFRTMHLKSFELPGCSASPRSRGAADDVCIKPTKWPECSPGCRCLGAERVRGSCVIDRPVVRRARDFGAVFCGLCWRSGGPELQRESHTKLRLVPLGIKAAALSTSALVICSLRPEFNPCLENLRHRPREAMGVRTGHHEQVFRRTHSFSDHPRQSQRNWIAGRWGHEDKNHEAETAKRLEELKRRILAGVEEFDIESYRKSDRELKAINNKRVRAFYEAQNQKLDDWAEVDGLVGALADDVVDSTDPDADLDGDINTDTPLYRTNHDVEVYLPSEQRERRARNRRVAGRALNVSTCCILRMWLWEGDTFVLGQHHCQHPAAHRQRHRCGIDTISGPDCLTCRFHVGCPVYCDHLGDEPSCSTEIQNAHPEIPCWTAAPRADWSSGLFYPRNCIVRTDLAGIRGQIAAKRRPYDFGTVTRGDWSNGRQHCA